MMSANVNMLGVSVAFRDSSSSSGNYFYQIMAI